MSAPQPGDRDKTRVLPEAAAGTRRLPRIGPVRAEDILGEGAWPPPGAAFEMGQSWLADREAGFRPGTVWVSASPGALVVAAELSDDHIATAAADDYQRLWELGDVFEILIRPSGAEGYFEFQVAPNGRIIQLRYPRPGLPLRLGIDAYLWRERCIETAVRVESEARRWRVAVTLPVESLLAGSPGNSGEFWEAAFCRYDYDRDGRFVLASTAALRAPSFHRIDEWSRVAVPGGFARQ